MRIADGLELGYCTSIHPANGWSQVFANVRAHAPALKAQLSPHEPFGIGLRLSGSESSELLERDRLDGFRSYLESEGLYVFTLNGFPHGSFHGGRVKDAVHAPDWRSEERVAYTLRLAEILAALRPQGAEGSISTSPLSYAPWVDRDGVWEAVTRNLVRVVEALVRIRRERGTLIHLDLEAEADGLLGDNADVARFYTDRLLGAGADLLAASVSTSRAEAETHLRDHVGVCLDVCHLAVAYEDPATVLEQFAAAGIRIGKVQLSAALQVPLAVDADGRRRCAAALEPFAQSPYLHQVVQRNGDGTLTRYPDLPDALPRIGDPRGEEWRVHFHVPIFVDRYDAFLSTQDELRRVLRLLREAPFSRQLEIETYTWDVLPARLRTDVAESIRREYEWVLDVLG